MSRRTYCQNPACRSTYGDRLRAEIDGMGNIVRNERGQAALVEASGRGRPARFCSDTCKKAGSRVNVRARDEAQARQEKQRAAEAFLRKLAAIVDAELDGSGLSTTKRKAYSDRIAKAVMLKAGQASMFQ